MADTRPLTLAKGPLTLAKGLPEFAKEPVTSADEEREGPTEREAVTTPETVLELVCEWLGLEDKLPTPELVREPLIEPDTEAEGVPTIVFVTDTLISELLEPTKLADTSADAEEAPETDALELAEDDRLARPDIDSKGDGLSLTDTEELPSPETVPELLKDILGPALELPEVVLEAKSLALYVPDTVSVTPVGKVVILGVEVPSCDTVATTLPLMLPDLDLPGEELTTPVFVIATVLLILREACIVLEGTAVKLTVAEADCDLLARAEPL